MSSNEIKQRIKQILRSQMGLDSKVGGAMAGRRHHHRRAGTMAGAMAGAKSDYINHVKKYAAMHPRTSWKECMQKASPSYHKKHGSGVIGAAKRYARKRHANGRGKKLVRRYRGRGFENGENHEDQDYNSEDEYEEVDMTPQEKKAGKQFESYKDIAKAILKEMKNLI